MSRARLTAHPELPQPSNGDAALLRSFHLYLRAEGRSVNTQNMYGLAARLHARWAAAHLDHGLDETTKKDIREYLVWMRETARKRNGEPYTKSYINNQFRCLQQFYKWLAEDEELPSPMDGMTPPKFEEKIIPVLTDEEVDGLIAKYEKRSDHDSRRNLALIRLFLYVGGRLSELTNITIDDIDLNGREVTVMGKGEKERIVRFDHKTARALDRYIRIRAKHKLAHLPSLWLGSNQRPPLTPGGVRQAIQKAGRDVGFHLHPHMFRHNFAHRFLDADGQEGDLMALMGWTSAQMLRRYGRSGRSARARRGYDRLQEKLMGGR